MIFAPARQLLSSKPVATPASRVASAVSPLKTKLKKRDEDKCQENATLKLGLRDLMLFGIY